MNEFESRVEYAKVRAAYQPGNSKGLIGWIMSILPASLSLDQKATDEEIQKEIDTLAQNARG